MRIFGGFLLWHIGGYKSGLKRSFGNLETTQIIIFIFEYDSQFEPDRLADFIIATFEIAELSF